MPLVCISRATASGVKPVLVAMPSVPEPVSNSVTQAAARAVEIGQRDQDHLQLLVQRARVQQPAAQLVQPVQVGHLLAELGLRATEQVVDGAALGDVDAGAAHARRAVAGPDDVDAQHQPALAAVGHGQAHFALVAGRALAQLARDHRAGLDRDVGRHPRHQVVQRHGAVARVDAAQQRQRRRQVDGARGEVEVEDADAGVLAGQHQALLRRGRARARHAQARAHRGQQHAEDRVDQQREVVDRSDHPPAAGRQQPQPRAGEADGGDEEARRAARARRRHDDRRQEEQERDLRAHPRPHRPLDRHGADGQGHGGGPALEAVGIGKGGAHGVGRACPGRGEAARVLE